MTLNIVMLARLFQLAVALALLCLAWMAWSRRRRAPEAPLVCLLIVSVAIYCIGYAGEVSQTTLAGAEFWLHVEYLGLPWLPALWVLLARKHNGLRSKFWVLLVVPFIAFIGQFTNSFHGLFDQSVRLMARPPFWVVVVVRGPIAWLFLAYLYGSLFYGVWLYLSRFRTSSRLFRKQSAIFAASGLPPLVAYLIYLGGWSPWGLDIAPAAMAISGVLAYFAIVKLECFNLVPMARSLVFNIMRDAVLVTDLQHRLVDYNPAAKNLLPCLGNITLGDDVIAGSSHSPVLEQAFHDPDHAHTVDLQPGGDLLHFEVRSLPLCIEEQQAGWAVILADITAQVRLVHELRRDAETDELTGVANRRSFVTGIERESARFRRRGSIFSVLIMDVDRFKDINDRFGHAAGDKVLSTVAERTLLCLRRDDLLSRFGGDEFAILLPETGADGAWQVAERIRSAVADEPLRDEDQALPMSVSIGVATSNSEYADDWALLVAEADSALYRAKGAGRNRVAGAEGVSFPETKGATHI